MAESWEQLASTLHQNLDWWKNKSGEARDFGTMQELATIKPDINQTNLAPAQNPALILEALRLFGDIADKQDRAAQLTYDELQTLLDVPNALGTGSRASGIKSKFEREVAAQLQQMRAMRSERDLQEALVKFWHTHKEEIERLAERAALANDLTYNVILPLTGLDKGTATLSQFLKPLPNTGLSGMDYLHDGVMDSITTLLDLLGKDEDNQALKKDCEVMQAISADFALEVMACHKKYLEAQGASRSKA